MASPRFGTTVRRAQPGDLETFRQRLAQIYLDAFTTDGYARNVGRLTEAEIIDDCRELLSTNGLGFLAFDSGQFAHPAYPIGFLFGKPLRFDQLLENTGLPSVFDVNRCHYLAELAIDRGHRGRGVGHQLVASYLESLDRTATDAVLLRTNESDPRVHAFYRSVGFEKLDATALQRGMLAKRYFCYRMQVSA
jgi:GNAT superfamily N-acetyltransferase